MLLLLLLLLTMMMMMMMMIAAVAMAAALSLLTPPLRTSIKFYALNAGEDTPYATPKVIISFAY